MAFGSSGLLPESDGGASLCQLVPRRPVRPPNDAHRNQRSPLNRPPKHQNGQPYTAYTDRAVAYVLAAVVYVAVGAFRWQQDRNSIEPHGLLHVVVWTLILGSIANAVIWVAFNR
jgi:hypothetical protein